MRGPYDRTEYNNAVKKYNADRTQQGGNPHQRSSVKNVGAGVTHYGHPISDAGMRLLLNDRKR